MSLFFIRRPNFAWVVALFIALAGLLAIPQLPVEQYPVVAPPQISIYATYPGASAKTVQDSVTSVLEQELNGAKDLLYYESSSNANGIAELTVTFQPGTNPDLAQVDVQNRLKKAEARLPQPVREQGIQVEQANAGFLLVYSLGYRDQQQQDVTALADYMARNINPEILRVAGVGKLQFFASEAAMRVWLDPQKLMGYGLSIDDVTAAISSQNIQVPAGSFGSSPAPMGQELTATINVNGALSTPAQFGAIILHANTDGSNIRLADVARIELGSQDYSFASRQDGKATAAAAVQLSPGANAIATVNAVKARLQELSQSFPDNMEYSVPYDTSRFVHVAINKVLQTLAEAMVLVFLVMLLFLQKLRYTLIPAIVVPVALLGTLATMYLLGFSVNMMTMFGMVLSIGILVDDAIVVVENVERIMAEEGLPPKAATAKAMQQVSGAIIGITLVLSAVFLPLAFMSGSVGVIYQQFSLTLSVSILFSGFLALTLTPALCATLLQPVSSAAQQQGFFAGFNRRFQQLTQKYTLLNQAIVRRTGRFMLLYVALLAVLGFSYLRVPEAFVPVEDQGYLIVDMQLPPGASRERTAALVTKLEQFLADKPALEANLSILGFSFSGMGENAALAFPTLKDWSQRSAAESAMALSAEVNGVFAGNTLGNLMAVTPPPIEGLGSTGGFALRLLDKGGLGREALLDASNQLLQAANRNPKILYAMMEGLADAPQVDLQIDRDKAQALGVSFSAITNAMATAFGSAMAGDFNNNGRQQWVVVQAEQHHRMTPDDALQLFIPNSSNALVPMSAFATASWHSGAVQLARYNGYPAIKISGDAAPGVSSGTAMAELAKIAATLPKGIGYEWTGLSYQEQFASGQASLLFILALLVVFLLLVALYESWSIPVSVMLIVPIGALGAVAAVMVAQLSNDVYFKVGLITVIGLSAKNAILIVEFAKEYWERGASLVDAAVHAAKDRFRPIIMTSAAFSLGVIPLVIAVGAGAESQRAIGTGVLGGMLSATFLGVIMVPVFFVSVLGVMRSRRPQHAAELTDNTNS